MVSIARAPPRRASLQNDRLFFYFRSHIYLFPTHREVNAECAFLASYMRTSYHLEMAPGLDWTTQAIGATHQPLTCWDERWGRHMSKVLPTGQWEDERSESNTTPTQKRPPRWRLQSWHCQLHQRHHLEEGGGHQPKPRHLLPSVRRILLERPHQRITPSVSSASRLR